MIELFITFFSNIFSLSPFMILFACMLALCVVLLVREVVGW